jgi:hypothetical protein
VQQKKSDFLKEMPSQGVMFLAASCGQALFQVNFLWGK